MAPKAIFAKTFGLLRFKLKSTTSGQIGGKWALSHYFMFYPKQLVLTVNDIMENRIFEKPAPRIKCWGKWVSGFKHHHRSRREQIPVKTS